MISVIVPIFNSEAYLDRCIQSICAQTYKDLEILLIDDGSTDLSLNICNKYAKIDARIKLLSKKNEGAAIARNEALKMAKGDYIGFVDSDDFIDPEMYRILMELSINYNADIVQCGHEKISQNGEKISKSNYKDKVIIGNNLCFREYAKGKNIDNYSPCKLFKRKIIENVYFGKFHYSEDTYFIAHAFCNCQCLVITNTPLYKYVQTIGSACRRPFNTNVEDTVKVGCILYDMCVNKYPYIAYYFARYTATWARECYCGYDHLKCHNYNDKKIYYWGIFESYYRKSKIIIPDSIKSLLLYLFHISPFFYMKYIKRQ